MSEFNKMKRADKRSSITVLVLGDEGVGKSSLISTFVSRYFSDVVPGIMTRVRLPPDPINSCITTIVDSQGGDAALLAATSTSTTLSGSSESLVALMDSSATSSLSASQQHQQQRSSQSASLTGIENVDSIVLVYDLDRPETFFRLENHWLPLIERCYKGKVPVIVAENKMDLFRPSASMPDDQALARKRQQIVSLMQRFPFVRQCIKCSAKNLLRVDDVFMKAQQAVIYPFTPPLYDLETGKLTAACKRAFTRIFRMYDRDHDGLLSDSEMDRFQRETYSVPIFERDLAAWKKVVTRNNPTDEVVIQDSKFTVPGFLAIFDIFISQNRLDVVWQALRKYGYDDDLNLHVPDSVSNPEDGGGGGGGIGAHNWKFTLAAKKFLVALFHQFDSDHNGTLSPEDIVAIFSILPPPSLPPWHPMRAPELFRNCFSIPKESSSIVSSLGGSSESPRSESIILPAAMSQSLSNSGISILSATDSLPSVDVGGIHPLSKPLSFLEWMGNWHLVSAISPSIARDELFLLGHVEDVRKSGDLRRRGRSSKKAVVPSNFVYEATLSSREIRVLVLGSRGCGKTVLLNALCGTFDSNAAEWKTTDTSSTTRPETSTTYIKVKRKTVDKSDEIVAHLVFTDVPEAAAASQEEHYRELSELFGSTASPKDRVCDLAMLIYDATQVSSFNYVKELESKLLTKETPRVFIGTKSDLVQLPEPEDGDVHPATVVDIAVVHCREMDLEEPLLVSAATLSQEHRHDTLDHLARCALNEPGIARLKSRPHEERKRREAARRRNILWLGSIVSVGIVVVAGVSLLLSNPKNERSAKRSGWGGWLRHWFLKDVPLGATAAES